MPKEKPETILRKYTAEVLLDPRFKDFVENMSKDVQKELLFSENAEDFESIWEAHKEANPIVREDKLQSPKAGSPVA